MIGQVAMPDLSRPIWIPLHRSSSPDPDNLDTPARSVWLRTFPNVGEWIRVRI